MFKVSYQGKSSTLIQFIKLDGLSSKETLKYNGGEPILHFPENNCQKLFLYKYGLQNDIFFSIDLLYYHNYGLFQACDLPMYWKALLFHGSGGEKQGYITKDSFTAMWKR